ncbi:MAG TPA: glycosyltransferase family 4 protein [Streptosporangiaceae bacterium]|nr:glycosyltransferase family 4 protein [Streptosporangiaceae bacterium]
MKLLMAAPYYYPRIGGVEIYARQLGIALRDLEGWEIVVVTSNEAGRSDIEDSVDGMKVCRLGTWGKLSNTPLGPLWPVKIRSIIRQERPDLILAHTPVPSMADAVALAAGRVPFLLAYHAATLLKAGSPVFNGIARAYHTYERVSLSRASRILAVSEYVQEQLPASVHDKTIVLPNAVWERDIRVRDQPTDTNFLFISSLDRTHAWKGLDLILQAIVRYREAYGSSAELTVLGDGNNRGHFEAAAHGLGLAGTVRFCGWQTGSAKEAAFERATALVLYPTTENDAFPTVMLEAWARGVPVVASRIGALPTLISEGQDGFLAAPHNPGALAGVLHRVAVTSPAERHRIAATAARRTRELYTWERQARDFARLASNLG